MVILGIDPGYAIVGFGLIRSELHRYIPLEYGAIVTDADQEFSERLVVIYNHMTHLLEKGRPDAIAIEKLFFNSNKTTAIGVAEARGVILLAAAQHNVPVFEYTPLQVKTAVTGYGRAEKPQVMEMTRRLLRLRQVPRPDDTADALAIAICHAQAAGSPLRRSIAAGVLDIR